jgi:hypothetical protein
MMDMLLNSEAMNEEAVKVSCENVINLLPNLVLKLLSPTSRDAVWAHIKTCRHCRLRLRGLEAGLEDALS